MRSATASGSASLGFDSEISQASNGFLFVVFCVCFLILFILFIFFYPTCRKADSAKFSFCVLIVMEILFAAWRLFVALVP